MKRRIMAWILGVVMLVSMLPTPAMAAETEVIEMTTEAPAPDTGESGGSPEPQQEQQSAPAADPAGGGGAAPEAAPQSGNAFTNNAPAESTAPSTQESTEPSEGGEATEPSETEGEGTEPAEGEATEPGEGESTGEGEQTEVGSQPEAPVAGTVQEISLSGAPKSAFVGEQINFLLHIQGTAEEYMVEWETETPDGTNRDSITTGAVDVSRSYIPHSYGTHTIRITVKAPDGSFKQAMAVIPVADHSTESEAEMFEAFEDYERTGNWNADLLAIAKSQIGYSESGRNFYIDNYDVTHGYTRYGAFYGGAEYDPWDALFVNFVARMAGIPEEYLPKAGTTARLQKALADEGAAIQANYILTTGEPGDLVFVQGTDAMQVGVLSEIHDDKIAVIVGDCDDRVQVLEYENGSELVLGFGDISALYDKAVAENAPTEVAPETKADETEEKDEQGEEKEEERVTGRTGVIYYCGFAPGYQHTHDESCYQGGDVPLCGLFEHTHTEKCTELPLKEKEETPEQPAGDAPTMDGPSIDEPTIDETENDETDNGAEEAPAQEYSCGLVEHSHSEACYAYKDVNENGISFQRLTLICGMEEHHHDETCVPIEDEEEQSEGENTETGDSEDETTGDENEEVTYYCGKEEHTHTEDCYGMIAPENGMSIEEYGLVCGKEEHTHTEECTVAPEEDESDEETEAPTYYCGLEEHTHTDACYTWVAPENGMGIEERVLTCGKEEHTHSEACLIPPEESEGEEGEAPEVTFYCGMEAHTHTEECYDEDGNLICEIPEHVHHLNCLLKPVEYICGLEEHTHTEECYDEEGNLICGKEEHVHSDLCLPQGAPSTIANNATVTLTPGKIDFLSAGNTIDVDDPNLFTKSTEKVTIDNATYDVHVRVKLGKGGVMGSDTTAAGFVKGQDEYKVEITQDMGFYSADGSELTPQEKHVQYNPYKITFEPYVLVNGNVPLVLDYECSVDNVQVVAGKVVKDMLDSDSATITGGGFGDPDHDNFNDSTIDGTSPFDTEAKETDTGRDKGPHNQKVRTFDTVSYTTYFTTKMKGGDKGEEPVPATDVPDDLLAGGYNAGRVYYEYVILGGKKALTEENVRFADESMQWINSDGAEHNPVEVWKNGQGGNDLVLRGSYVIKNAQEGASIIGANYQSRQIVVQVRDMKNGEQIDTAFTYWLDYSDVGVNYIPGTHRVDPESEPIYRRTEPVNCKKHGVQEYVTIEGEPITVSAKPMYNVRLDKANESYNMKIGDFDFSDPTNQGYMHANTGKVERGTMYAVGITLQLYNEVTSNGMRGMQLPDENTVVTFDMHLSSKFEGQDGDKSIILPEKGKKYEFSPRVWAAGPSVTNWNKNTTQQPAAKNRTIESPLAAYIFCATPYNYNDYRDTDLKVKENMESAAGQYNRCFDGGEWTFTVDDKDDSTIHVRISGIRFNLDLLPSTGVSGQKDTNTYFSPSIKDRLKIYQACLSGGALYMVQPFTFENGANVLKYAVNGTFTSVTSDNNLAVYDGDKLLLEKVNKQTKTNDDSKETSIALKRPGSFDTKIFYSNPGSTAFQDGLITGSWSTNNDWALKGSKVGITSYLYNRETDPYDSAGVAYDHLVKFDDNFMMPTRVRFNNMADTDETGAACMTFNAYWAFLKGHETEGWQHSSDDPSSSGYDTSMRNATPKDMTLVPIVENRTADAGTWYSYDACAAAHPTWKPVGVYIELRGVHYTVQKRYDMWIEGTVLNSAKTGGVYMCTMDTYGWRKQDVREAVLKWIETEKGNDSGLVDAYGYPTNRAYYEWVNDASHIPSRGKNNSASTPYNKYTYKPGYLATNGKDLKDTRGTDGGPSGPSNEITNFVKASYEDQNYHAGVASYEGGDSCLVMGHRSAVTIDTSNGTSFNLNDAQRHVDVAVHPSIVFGQSTSDQSESEAMAKDIVVEVYIPEGLNYEPNSVHLGGKYTGCATRAEESGKYEDSVDINDGGSATPDRILEYSSSTKKMENLGYFGEITLDAPVKGVKVPKLTETGALSSEYEEGTYTKLTLHVAQAKINRKGGTAQLPMLQFACTIGTPGLYESDVCNDSPYQASFPIRTIIWCAEDKNSEKSQINENLDVCSVEAFKNPESGVYKAALQNVVEVGAPHSFMMTVDNTSTTNIKNAVVVDTMPINGENGSSFHGQLVLNQIMAGGMTDKSYKNLMGTNFEFYYNKGKKFEGLDSKDAVYANYEKIGEQAEKKAKGTGKAAIQAELKKDGWMKVPLNTKGKRINRKAGSVDVTYEVDQSGALDKNATQGITALLMLGDVPPKTTLYVEAELSLTDGKPADKIVNGLSRLSMNQLSSGDESGIASRRLKGLTWMDKNQNGVQDSDEKAISGFTATLYQLKNGMYEAVPNASITTGGTQYFDMATGHKENATGEFALKDGEYLFVNLTEGTYGVRITDGTGAEYKMARYALSPKDQSVVQDGNYTGDYVDSDADASMSGTKLGYASITGIRMPPANELQGTIYESFHHDAGFYYGIVSIEKKVEQIGKQSPDAALAGKSYKIQVKADAASVTLLGAKEYSFTITDVATSTLVYGGGVLTFGSDGIGKVKAGGSPLELQDGQKIKITDLPIGAKFTVTEDEAAAQTEAAADKYDMAASSTTSEKATVTAGGVATVTVQYPGAAADEKVNPWVKYTNTYFKPEKTETNPGDGAIVGVGQVLEYTISWANTESTPATVTITDKLDPGLTFVSAENDGDYNENNRTITWTLKDQVAGATGTVSFKATVNENAVKTPDGTGKDYKVENNATVTVDGHPDVTTDPVENSIPEKTEVTPNEGDLVMDGETITYNIAWRNSYDEPAKVVITDELDPGVDFVSASYLEGFPQGKEPVYDSNTRTVTWTIENAPAKANGKVELVVEVNANAKKTWNYKGTTGAENDYALYNRAGVSVDNKPEVQTDTLWNPVTDPHKVETTPGDTEQVEISTKITYEIDWQNYKNEPATVTITDALDPGVDFVKAWFVKADETEVAIPTPGKATTIDGSDTQGDIHIVYDHKHTVTWTLKDRTKHSEGKVYLTVEVNEDATKKVTYTDGKPTEEDGEDFEVLNQAGVQVGNDPVKYTEIPWNPVPDTEKTEVTPHEGDQLKVGDEVTYEIKWQNFENGKATVTITDKLDEGVDFVNASDGGIYDAATHTVTWTLAKQERDAQGTVTLIVKVNEAAQDADYAIENGATVEVGNGYSVDTNVVKNPVPEKKEIRIERGEKSKADGWTDVDGSQTDANGNPIDPNRQTVQIGDEITYRIWYSALWEGGKTGDTTTVTITDTLDPGVDFVKASTNGVTLDGLKTYIKGTDNSEISYNPYSSDPFDRTVTWKVPEKYGNYGYVELTVRVNEHALDAYTYDDNGKPVAGQGEDFEVLNRAGVTIENDTVYTEIPENPVPDDHKTSDDEGVQKLVGEKIEYTITWRNHYNRNADVVVTDKLDEGVDFVSADNGGIYDAVKHTVTWNLGKRAAHDSGTLTLIVQINDKARVNHKVENQAKVLVDNQAVGTENIETPVPEKDEIGINYSDEHKQQGWTDIDENSTDVNGNKIDPDGKMVQIGDEITYEIYYNAIWKGGEEGQTTTVTVTDALDPGVDFVSASNPGMYDKDAHTVTWTINNVLFGAEGSVKLTVRVNENAKQAYTYGDKGQILNGTGEDFEVLNQASVTIEGNTVYTEIPENPVTEPHKTEETPGAGTQVKIGDEITYEIEWQNSLDKKADVIVTDTLDRGVDFVSSEPLFTRMEKRADGQTVVTWKLEDVKENTKGTVKLTVKVNKDATAEDEYASGDPVKGMHKEENAVWNQASVQVGNNPAMWTEEIPNSVTEKKEIKVERATGHDNWDVPAGSDMNGVPVLVGDTITYQIEYNAIAYTTDENGKKVPSEKVTVKISDALDPGVDFVEATQPHIYDTKKHTVSWTFENLPFGTHGSVELKVKVNEKADLLYGYKDGELTGDGTGEKDFKVLNQAKVTVGDDTEYTEIPKNPVPEPHKTEKTPGDKLVTIIGEPVGYEIEWNNFETETAKVTITDPLDVGVDFVSAGFGEGAMTGEEPDENGNYTYTDGLEGETLRTVSYNASTHTVTWTFWAKAGAHGIVPLSVKVNAKALEKAEWKFENQAEVQVGNHPGVKTEKPENPVSDPHKEEGTPGYGVEVDTGDVIDYTISWDNYKYNEAATVTVRDKLDPGVDFVSASYGSVTLEADPNKGNAENTGRDRNGAITIKYDAAEHMVTWTLENRPGQTSGKVTLKVQVNDKAQQDWYFNENAANPTDPNAKDAWTQMQGNGANGEHDGMLYNRAGVKVGNDDEVLTEIIPNTVPEKTEEEIQHAGGTTETKLQMHDVDVQSGMPRQAGPLVYEGDQITYHISFVAQSQDGSALKRVVVTDKLDPNVKFVGAKYDGVTLAAAEDADGNAADATTTAQSLNLAGKDSSVIIAYDAATHTVTWTMTNVPSSTAKRFVELTVEITADAILPDNDDNKVENGANVKFGTENGANTNIVENPTPEFAKTEQTPGAGEQVLMPGTNGKVNGSEITYTIHWKNYNVDANGKPAAATVTITDTLDPGVDYVNSTGGTYNDRNNPKQPHTVIWTIQAQPLEEGDVTLTVEVNELAHEGWVYEDGVFVEKDDAPDGGYWVYNQAHMNVGNGTEVFSEIIPNPVPHPEKTEKKPTFEGLKPGDEIPFVITWWNHETAEDGTALKATVTVTDPLEAGLDLVSGSIHVYSEDGKEIKPDSAEYNDPKTLVVKFTAEPGAHGTVEFTAKVNENAVHGVDANGNATDDVDEMVANKATVQVGNNDYVETNSVDNPVSNPHKTESVPGNGQPVKVPVYDENGKLISDIKDSTISYKIDWANYKTEADLKAEAEAEGKTESVTTATVTIVDKLDPGVDFVSASYGSAKLEGYAGPATGKATGGVKVTITVEQKNETTPYDTVTWKLENVPARSNRVLNEEDELAKGSKGTVELTVQLNENAVKEYRYGVDKDGKPTGEPGLDPETDGRWVYNQASVQVNNDDVVYTEIPQNPVPPTEKTETEIERDSDEGRSTIELTGDDVYGGVPVRPGDEILYRIYWWNYESDEKTGEHVPAEKIVVNDPLDANVKFLEAGFVGYDGFEGDATLPEGWGVETAEADGQTTVTWTMTKVPQDADGYVWVRVEVLDTLPETGIVNPADVTVGNHPTQDANKVPNPPPEDDKKETNITPAGGRKITPESGDTNDWQDTLVFVGDTIEYTIRYQNDANYDTDITITDKLDAGVDFVSAKYGDVELSLDENGELTGGTGDGVTIEYDGETVTWTLKDVPKFETGEVKLEVKVNQKATPVGKVKNQAQVKVGNFAPYDTDEPENPTPQQVKTEVTPGAGEMVLPQNLASQAGNPDYNEIPQSITYQIAWENYQNADAKKVVVTDNLDPGVDFVQWESETTAETEIRPEFNAGSDGRHLSWTFKNVPAGTKGVITFTVMVNEDAYKTYTYDADGDEPVAGSGTDDMLYNRAGVKIDDDPKVLTDIIPNPVPEVPKKATSITGSTNWTNPAKDTVVFVGDTITYEIDWWNYAVDKNTLEHVAATVTVTDPLDEKVDFVSASYNGVTLDAADGSITENGITIAYANRTVTWTIPADADQRGTVTLTVLVNDKANGGKNIINQAGARVNNGKTVASNPVEHPTPELEKEETSPGENETVHVGDGINYTIHWKNYKPEETDAEGNPKVYDVEITDELDPGVDFLSASYDAANSEVVGEEPVYDPDSHTVTWTLHNVPGQAEGWVLLSVQVNARARDGWHYENGTPTADDAEDNKVINQGGMRVGNDSKVLTNPVENPVPGPKKTETEIDHQASNLENETKPPMVDVTEDGENYKTVAGPEVFVGDTITYEISWRNYDEKAETSDVTITDPLDRGVDFVSADNGGAYSGVTRHTVTWVIPNTKFGDEGTVKVTVRVNSRATSTGVVENYAHVQVGNNPADETEHVENPTPNPRKEVAPGTGSPAANTQVDVGDTITYRVRYHNYKSEAATVTVRDRLDPEESGLDFIEAWAVFGGQRYALTNNMTAGTATYVINPEAEREEQQAITISVSGKTVTWTMTNRPAGEEAYVYVTAQVNAYALDIEGAAGTTRRGEVINYASVQVDDDPEVEVEPVQHNLGDQPTPPPPGPGGEPEPGVVTTSLTGNKFWNDNGDAAGLRPGDITVTLYRDGVAQTNRPTWTRNGNTWTYRFDNLPMYVPGTTDDNGENGTPYRYEVRETVVPPNYQMSQSGNDITNTLLPPNVTYTTIGGTKTWNDNNDLAGLRPDSITVRLYRDGTEIDSVTVTAETNWRYSFTRLPVNDGYGGADYVYTVSEDPVENYYTVQNGTNFVNGLIPGREPGEPGPGDFTIINDPGVPLFGLPTEEELEDLIQLFDYDTPLWGDLMKTGDELPIYPFLFAGLGAAIVAVLLVDRKKRKAKAKG